MRGYNLITERRNNMAFELYFNISRTAVELLALGLVVGCGVYIAQDLITEKEPEPEYDFLK